MTICANVFCFFSFLLSVCSDTARMSLLEYLQEKEKEDSSMAELSAYCQELASEVLALQSAE